MKAASTSLLAAIAVAMASPPNYMFADPKDAKELVDAGLAEGNPEIKNPENEKQIAFRLTDKGQAEAKNSGNGGNSVPTFVIAAVPRPAVRRLGEDGGGSSKYPFEKLEPGQAFFIPSPPDMKQPSKSFGSMVSAANKRFRNNEDYRRFTTRSMTGDAFGQPGVKGIAVFRMTEAEEAKYKADEEAKAKKAEAEKAAAAAAPTTTA